jgi:hypothetical protein
LFLENSYQMPEPEIARRCTECGASIRGAALFCPQCGNPLGDKAKTAKVELVEGDTEHQLVASDLAPSSGENETDTSESTIETAPEATSPEPELMSQADTGSADGEAMSTEVGTEAASPESALTEDHTEAIIAEPATSAELTADVGRGSAQQNPHSQSPRELADTLATPGTELAASPARISRQQPPDLDKRHRLQRAAAGAREAFEDGAQRVEKIRKISSVVIDQASYDPSLRFILVAAALFLVFLTILIISKLIG